MHQIDHYKKIKKSLGKAVIAVFVTFDHLERETPFAYIGTLKEYRVDHSELTPLIVIEQDNGSEICFNVNGCDIPPDPDEENKDNDEIEEKTGTKCFNFLLELYSNDPQDKIRGSLIYSNEEMENDSLSSE